MIRYTERGKTRHMAKKFWFLLRLRPGHVFQLENVERHILKKVSYMLGVQGEKGKK